MKEHRNNCGKRWAGCDGRAWNVLKSEAINLPDSECKVRIVAADNVALIWRAAAVVETRKQRPLDQKTTA